MDDSRFEPLIPTGDEEDFTPGVLNQYTVAKGESLSYDGNGNLANDGTNTYVYDAENRLISASNTVSSSYTYDSFGRRSLKTVDGTSTTFIYDGDQVIAEYNGSGALVRKFVFGPGIDEPVILEDVAARYYYHADSLGSVIALSNDAGAYAETYAYSSWGQVVTGSSVGNPYLYTGRRLDPETGIYYYRNRYYDANLRRFLQADPIGYAGGMNLYAYVGNSPWSYVDPWGLAGIILHIPGSEEYEASVGRRRVEAFKADKNKIARPFIVSGHGTNKYMLDQRVNPKGIKRTPKEIAKMIVHHGEYFGEDILLTGCSTGKGFNSFAQLLADEMAAWGYNVVVTAPTDTHRTNTRTIKGTGIILSSKSSVDNNGFMKAFRARGQDWRSER